MQRSHRTIFVSWTVGRGEQVSTTLVTSHKKTVHGWRRRCYSVGLTVVSGSERSLKVTRALIERAPPKFVQRLITAQAKLAKQRWSSVHDFWVGRADTSVHELAASGAKLWLSVVIAAVHIVEQYSNWVRTYMYVPYAASFYVLTFRLMNRRLFWPWLW